VKKLLIACAIGALAHSGAAMAADAEAEAKVTDKKSPDYIRCVKIADTGSLVAKTKICHTNAVWRKVNEQNRRDAEDNMARNAPGQNPN
jgi:uncharacterized protein YcfJ